MALNPSRGPYDFLYKLQYQDYKNQQSDTTKDREIHGGWKETRREMELIDQEIVVDKSFSKRVLELHVYDEEESESGE